MHARYSSRLTKLFVGTAFFFLAVMLGLTMTDVLSRGLKTYPGGAGGLGIRRASSGGDRCGARGAARGRTLGIRNQSRADPGRARQLYGRSLDSGAWGFTRLTIRGRGHTLPPHAAARPSTSASKRLVRATFSC
jgi:hypothetical protein